MSRRSRLNRRLEKKSQKTLLLSVIGIILIGAALLKFGIPLIADLGFLSSQIAPKNETKKTDTKEVYLSPPSIHPLPSATNEEGIEISGSSTTGEEVIIYLNGSEFGRTRIEEGSFSLRTRLSEGENIIKSKAASDGKESQFSDPIAVNYKKDPPELTISSPTDGQTTKESSFNVSGKTDPDTQVTVNGFRAIVNNNGDFSYKLSLKEGENEVKIDAIDDAGNKTEKSVRLHYSP